MRDYVYFGFLFAFLFIAQSFLTRFRYRITEELKNVLYFQNKPDLYLQLLENKKLRWLFKKSTILQFRLDAYLVKGESNKTEDLFTELDEQSMTKGEALEFNQKKLSYYCTQGNEVYADQALKKIKDILRKSRKANHNKIVENSQLIYDIYISHETNLIPLLEQLQNMQTGIDKGITLYQIAKLHHFLNEDKTAIRRLQQAKPLLINTYWFDIIESALKNSSVLETK